MKNFVQMVQNEYIMTEKEIEHFIVEAGNMAIDYLEQNNLNGIVLGLSGGLDSTVSAYIIRKAIERRKSDKKLLGINICIGNSEEHLRYADEVGKITCDAYLQFDEFKDSFKSFNESVSKSSDVIKAAGLEVSNDPVSMGNLKARLRMMILYDIAKKSNCIVLGSDNRSETQNGFFTMHGDGACDMNLLYDIYKGLQLWQIAKALDIPEYIINQAPSDGLGITKEDTDESQLGYSYLESDAIMTCYLNDDIISSETMAYYKENIVLTPIWTKVIKRFNDTEFKRSGPFLYWSC